MGALTHSSLTARVLKALGIFGSLEVVTMLCAVIRTKLVALWLGTAGVGVISLYNSTIEMLRVITQLNIRQSAVREIASVPVAARSEIAHITLSLGFWLGVGGTVLVAVLSPLLSILTFGSCDYTWGFVLLSLTMLLSTVADARRAVLQAMDRLRSLALASLWGALVATVLALPMFYFFRMHAIVPVMIVFSASSLAVLMFYKVDKSAVRPGFARFKACSVNILRLGACLSVAHCVGSVAEYVLRVYINTVADTDTVGLFQSGFTIINNYVGLIFTAIAMEFYPRLSVTINRPDFTRVVVSHEIGLTLTVLMLIVVLFISADELIVRILYSQNFLAIVPFLGIAILSTFLRAVSWCFSYVIIAKGEGRVYILTETSSALSLLVFSYFGWTCGGLTGLGAAYLGQFIVFTAVTWWVCHRRYGIVMPRRTVWLVIISCIVGVLALGLKVALGWWAPLLLIPLLVPFVYRSIRRRKVLKKTEKPGKTAKK